SGSERAARRQTRGGAGHMMLASSSRSASHERSRSVLLVRTFLALSALEGLAVLVALLADTPTSQAGWLLGFTRLRVLIIGATLALTAAATALSLKSLADTTWAGRIVNWWARIAAQGRTSIWLTLTFYALLLASILLLVGVSMRSKVEPNVLSKLWLNRGQLFLVWLTIIALQAVLAHAWMSGARWGRMLGTFVGGGLLLGLLLLYWYGAEGQLLLYNTNRFSTDQSAYMKYARLLRESNYSYPGDFNRMPLYPWIQSLLLQPEMTDPEFFEYGKYLNLYLSIGVLAGLALVFFRSFTPLHALNLLTVAAFSVFIYKAGWFQSEVIFYFLNLLLFVLMIRQLQSTSTVGAIATGLVAGLAHLTKASILPGLLLFLLFAILRNGMHVLSSGRAPRAVTPRRLQPSGLWAAPLAGLAFLATVSPYLIRSKEITGHYFYNVNSTFYVWYDSWDEAMAGTRAHGDRTGWPQMPPEDIPSMGKYLREHTPGQMATRLIEGGYKVMKRVSESYGYWEYAKLYAGLLVIACALRWRRAWTLIKGNPIPLLFALAYFMAYPLLYFWYAPIAYGDRLILAQFLPLVYALSMALHCVLNESYLIIAGRSIRWLDLVNVALVPIVGMGVYRAVTHGVYVMSGGG
ncbi:MAG TPA: hypothetical protein VFI11_08795, partial [Anaerolineales bacterium]|nr:hypothetical protein [Anaerolineales bacterium]